MLTSKGNMKENKVPRDDIKIIGRINILKESKIITNRRLWSREKNLKEMKIKLNKPISLTSNRKKMKPRNMKKRLDKKYIYYIFKFKHKQIQ